MIKVWVCQVRREAFVGGESQRCRHAGTLKVVQDGTAIVEGCGEMELIGGEPIEWCETHQSNGGAFIQGLVWRCYLNLSNRQKDPCQFESQRRVGP